MICSSSSPPIRRLRGEGRGPRGFTLVELLAVILILAVLIALLLPAFNLALRTAKNSAASAEISQMAQALAQFKSQFGVYPPSRVVLSETGDYSPATIQSVYSGLSAAAATALSQRSVSYLRRTWPKMVLSTSGPIVNSTTKVYDFTGTGTTTSPTLHIIQGAECLTFFLGGIPQQTSTGWAVVGFAKNPANPMQNAVLTSNRSSPMFEFRPGRLVDLDGNGFPEYLDGLGGSTLRPFVYFSAYEGQGYDPDDNNYNYHFNGVWLGDPDDAGSYDTDGIGVLGGFSTPNAPTGTQNVTGRTDIVASAEPNPYTNDDPVPIDYTQTPPVINTADFRPRDYINKNTYQLFSAGLDNDFGIGGTFNSSGSGVALPFVVNPTSQATGQTLSTAIRSREGDNLTNFNSGRLD